jgi:hypothetical protein
MRCTALCCTALLAPNALGVSTADRSKFWAAAQPRATPAYLYPPAFYRLRLSAVLYPLLLRTNNIPSSLCADSVDYVHFLLALFARYSMFPVAGIEELAGGKTGSEPYKVSMLLLRSTSVSHVRKTNLNAREKEARKDGRRCART